MAYTIMRLDKYLADMGYGTRKEVKELIKKGLVEVDGVKCKKADMHLSDDNEVRVDGEVVEYVEYEYYLLNKPGDYITATEDNNHAVVMDLIVSRRKDLVPVGRLDKDTEGALLITNDGVLGHHLISPKYHVKKKYYVEVDADLPKDAKEIFAKPMEFSDFTADPAEYEAISERSAYLIIGEGKYHQVKRMLAAVGNKVEDLPRHQVGLFELPKIPEGEWLYLSATQKQLSHNIALEK